MSLQQPVGGWYSGSVAVAACLLLLPLRANATPLTSSDQDAVQRALTMLSAVGEEYREGVQDGQVVRPIELDEAQSFLTDARQRIEAITGPSNGELKDRFENVATAIQKRAPSDAVSTQLVALRERVVVTTGVQEQIYPPGAPSVTRGQALFGEYCVTCHGEHGDGKGPSAARLNPPPANFTDPNFIRGETPYDFFHVISLGKSHTAMPSWDGALSIQDRWDLISYLWTLAPTNSGLAEGQGIYLSQCAGCHGAAGNGQGTFSSGLMKPAPDLSQPQALARDSDAALFATTTHGIAGSPMPSFVRALSDDDRWKAVAFLRLLSLGGPPAANVGPTGSASNPGRSAGLARLLGRSYSQAWTGDKLTDQVEYNEALVLSDQVMQAGEAIARRAEGAAPDVAAKLRNAATALHTQVREQAAPAQVSAAADALAGLIQAQPADAVSGSGGAPVQNGNADSRRR